MNTSLRNDLVGIEEQHNSVLGQMRLIHDLHNQTQSELVTLSVETEQFQKSLDAGLWRVLATQEMKTSPTLQSYLDKEEPAKTTQQNAGVLSSDSSRGD